MAAPTWPHWELQLLHAAGLPTTHETKFPYEGNVNWLSNWSLSDSPRCDRNPLNISHHAPRSINCKHIPSSKIAQAYATRDSAANAFAEQLNLTDYPDLRKALASGYPDRYGNIDGLLVDLQKWGSTGWLQNQRDNAGIPAPPPSSSGASHAASNVAGAWTHLHRVLSNEGHRTIVELERSAAAMRTIDRRLRRV